MKTPCLVVFDTNVWVSALFWGGIPNQLIQLWREEKIQPVFSEEIFNEWLKEAGKKAKIFQQEEKFLQYLRLIKKWATFVRIKERVAVCPHEPDNRFLEAALAGRAKVIISGDKHLLELKEFRGIEIKSPREFLHKTPGAFLLEVVNEKEKLIKIKKKPSFLDLAGSLPTKNKKGERLDVVKIRDYIEENYIRV